MIASLVNSKIWKFPMKLVTKCAFKHLQILLVWFGRPILETFGHILDDISGLGAYFSEPILVLRLWVRAGRFSTFFTYNTNSISALSQLLMNQFWPNFMSRYLQPFLTEDICPNNICWDNICPCNFSFLGNICPTSTTFSNLLVKDVKKQ